jgi:hypothetical protein
MSLWLLLVLAVFGMLLCQIMSFYALEMENHANPELNPLYPFVVTLALIGVFLSAICLTKIVRELDGAEGRNHKEGCKETEGSGEIR